MSDTKIRNIKIVSDGTRTGTSVIDVESGEQIMMVMDISIQIDPLQGIIATLKIFNPELDMNIFANEIEPHG